MAWEQNRQKTDALLTRGQLQRGPLQSTLHCPDHSPPRKAKKEIFFDKLKYHYQ